MSVLLANPAGALDLKLWPLIDYHSDADGHRALRLIGPLFAYEKTPEQLAIRLRPLISFTRGSDRDDRQFTLLYPLLVSRWDADSADHRFFGLISYRTQVAVRPEHWERRFTIFPLVFYRWSRARGTSLSVLPLYADLRDFLGYERIRMVAFPLYLRLYDSLGHRTWLPFPFIAWAGGTLARGYRFWPLYGWQRDGESERFQYVLWPFYISHERHFTRPERERQLMLLPFHWRIDSPTLWSRAYFGVTHSIDHAQRTDTWGFPWPFWLWQRDLDTAARSGVRIFPLYQDTHLGNLHARFILWPIHRWRRQEVDSYRHTRSDVLLLLYRDVEQVDAERSHRRRLRTLFPLFRSSTHDDSDECATLALLDALFPRNPTIRQLYAPLWQLYTHARDAGLPPRWSLLWDLVSSDGTKTRYPLHVDLSR